MNLDALKAALPPDQAAQRAAALAQFAEQGFPGPALEHWHYSDYSSLDALNFATEQPASAAAWAWDAATPLPLGAAAALAAEPRFAFDALNAALASQGANAVLGDGSINRLTQVAPDAGAMCHWRHHLQLAAQHEATLIVWDGAATSQVDSADQSFATARLHLELAAGSRLTVIRVQDGPSHSTLATHLSAKLGKDAELRIFNLDFGSRRARFEPHILLAEPGAALHYASLAALSGKSQADTQLRVQHAAPHCTSRIEARLIASGRSRAICNPQVIVSPGADKTDSETRCHSLLLSDKAEIDAKPELMIDADDVKCAHGATFGQLDTDAAFYLRSRGLSAAAAQNLLTLAFANSVLAQLPLPLLRDWASSKVENLLTEASST